MGQVARTLFAAVAVCSLAAAYSCRLPWWLGPMGIAAFLASLRGARPRTAAQLGLGVGTLVSATALSWLPEGLARSSRCTFPIAVLIASGAALAYGVRYCFAAWADARAVANDWPEGAGFIPGFAASELVLPGPMPWYLGVTAHDEPVLLQVAGVFGPIGVSTAVVCIGFLLLNLTRLVGILYEHGRRPSGIRHDPRVRSRTRGCVCWGALVVAFCTYGIWKLSHPTENDNVAGRSSRIGIVQHNSIPESTRSARVGIDLIRQQVLATWKLRGLGAELVVWGESAVSVAVPIAKVRELYPRLFTAALGVPSLIGAALTADTPARFYNTAVSLNERGEVLDVYVKRRLVPFSEELPGKERFRFLSELFPDARELPGEDRAATVELLGHPVSVVICFESLLPTLVRESLMHDRGQALFALVNDAWFGNTWEPWMHFAAAKLRAVENHRYVVRASGTGISGIIDPFGRVRERSRPLSPANLLGRIDWHNETTPYQRFGDYPWWLAGPGVLFVAVTQRRRIAPRSCSQGKNPV